MEYISFEFLGPICPEAVLKHWPEAVLATKGFTLLLDTSAANIHQEVITRVGETTKVTTWKCIDGTWVGFNHPEAKPVPISEEILTAIKKTGLSTSVLRTDEGDER